MSKRLLTALSALGLVAAACGGSSEAATVDLGSGTRFVPAVVDSLDDVGAMPSIALDGDGVPFIPYFGFPAELEPGEIPVSRSVYAPWVPSVLMASESDGIFTRGAVAMAEPPPNLVTIPFGPAIEGSVSNMTPSNVNGTSVAVDGQGGIHVAWVSDTGLWYGEGGASASFAVDQVLKLSPKLTEAGPLGWPAIAVDPDGNPWIAYGDDTGSAQVVNVVVREGNRWETQEVASFDRCGGCPQPARTAIGVTPDGPVVAYADTSRETPVAATFDGESWNPQEIEGAGGGTGLSMGIDGDGVPHVAYYTDGSVHAAVFDGSAWNATPVGDVGEAEIARYETTGIAVDDQGVTYVGYYDGGSDSIVLASDGEGEFATLETPGTTGGAEPSVAVTPDGSAVLVAWYDHVNQDLNLGILGDATAELAKPSPTTEATGAAPAPTGGDGSEASCESTGSSADISAPVGASGTGFDTQCLAVDAGKGSSVTFDNQDTGVPHNWDLFEDSGYTQSIVATDLTPGPDTQTADLPTLKSGTYYFHCDAHPATMTGQLTIG